MLTAQCYNHSRFFQQGKLFMTVTSINRLFERELVPGVTLDDLDISQITHIIQNARELGRYEGTDNVLDYLERYHGIEHVDGQIVPTVAGVLAFAREPDRWLTFSGIDVGLFGSAQTLPTRSRVQQVRGPIFTVIDQAVELLKQVCTTMRLEGARLVPELDTPIIVLRELTTNAVVHRDLGIVGSQVRLHVYPNTIEWSSPGGLPAGITVETLLTAQYARNPNLAQFLYHAGYIERFGMGLDAVIEALRINTMGDPEFYDDRHSFRVRIRRATAQEPTAPNLSTPEGRAQAIMEIFSRQKAWRQNELQQHLNIPRSTLQRDLVDLVRQGRLTAQGATRNRIYILSENKG
jgi:predicted HTH transcriptional regulator